MPRRGDIDKILILGDEDRRAFPNTLQRTP